MFVATGIGAQFANPKPKKRYLLVNGTSGGVSTPVRTDGLTAFTFACKAFFSILTTGKTQTFVCSAESAGSSLELKDTGALNFSVHASGAYGSSVGPILTANQWYTLIGVYDGTNVQVFADGTAGTLVAKTGAVTASPVSIGVGMNPGPTTNTAFLNGGIRDARVYNRALTSTERTNYLKGLIPRNGLLGEWLTNNHMLDTSGNLKHATFLGGTWKEQD